MPFKSACRAAASYCCQKKHPPAQHLNAYNKNRVKTKSLTLFFIVYVFYFNAKYSLIALAALLPAPIAFMAVDEAPAGAASPPA